MLNSIAEVTQSVGRIEERFILAKAVWAMGRDLNMVNDITRVMTTGDWFVAKLTDSWKLSTSDGVSNGLLDQKTKELSEVALRYTSLTGLVPRPISSNQIVATVSVPQADDAAWGVLKGRLAGWRIGASLGDNHGGAVSCLSEDDPTTMVASFGSSGTVICACSPDAELVGKAATFEFFGQRLLLSMLAKCGSVYDEFRREYVPERTRNNHAEIDSHAELVSGSGVVRLDQAPVLHPHNWSSRTWQQKTAIMQLSIVKYMLQEAEIIIQEVKGRQQPISHCVLLGGLSRSPLVQQGMRLGLQSLDSVLALSHCQLSAGISS